MAAYNAPANAYHGSSRYCTSQLANRVSNSRYDSLCQSNSLTSSSLRPVFGYATQSTSPASPPPRDYRWKRGRPVIFSSRAFGTTPVDLPAQVDHAAAAAGPEAHGAQQVHNQQEPGTSLPQSNQRSTGYGGTVVAMHQDISAELSTCAAEHDRSISAHVDPAITFNAQSEEDHTAGILKLSSADIPSAPGTDFQAQSSLTGDRITDDAADTDFLQSSNSTEQEDAASEGDEISEEMSETHTPLEFQIPEDLLRAAMNAPDNSKASFWSSNLYRGPKDKRIAVHYCKSKEVAERVAQHFVNQAVVGFDIEWKPYAAASSIKKNVSLIQLACEDRIALFHVALFKGTSAAQLMPPTLKLILESPDIYKVGVAVKGDFSRIIKFLGIEPQGVFELSRLHNLVQFSATEPSKVTNKLVGLATQVQQHLQLPLYKGGHLVDDPEDLSNVRSSDWSLPLNTQQIHYAAADAYAGFRLYDALEGKRKQLKPTRPRPLVCDYDSKPKPRTSKPPKKRRTSPKTDAVAVGVAGEAAAPTEQEEAEQASEESKDMQETEGYGTAQEELIDSHQLEGEEPESSQESYEETSESEDDLSIDSVLSTHEGIAAAKTDPSQKQVGRIDFSQLKGPDPQYPNLPDLGGEQAPALSSDGASIADTGEEERLEANDNVAKVPLEIDSGQDEFEDSELEEALRGLNIDGDGKLWGDTGPSGTIMPPTQPDRLRRLGSSAEQPQVIEEARVEVVESLPSPAQGTTHTPDYDLATSWAQSYLASTIPSPNARTPSHIRATVPHLRAYSLWHHQGLSLSEIAGRLRDPPLSESTVGSYVLQAIVLERMEYDREEVRQVLMGMPEALRRGKWRGLADKVGVNG
ncbi:Exodeoxyribonuclease I [Ascochyta rabiei]|nr:Exodeoxyribonuclease I [Ascochyta rabiei]UPX17757.1 Exodeoxyribonuclease I [Ascochyta rabiei]